jgi:hypothetical protein
MDSLILRLRHDAASATEVMQFTTWEDSVNGGWVRIWKWAIVTYYNLVIGIRLGTLRKTLIKISESSY